MTLRYGAQKGGAPVAYGETLRLPGGADATFLPAGHVLGSAQILLEYAGERVIVTGDYKRRPDPTCLPFVATSCEIGRSSCRERVGQDVWIEGVSVSLKKKKKTTKRKNMHE